MERQCALGGYTCELVPGTVARRAYRSSLITDELNNEYKDQLVKAGLVCSGNNPEKDLVEIIEIPSHPFFVGTQFHPEFTSRPFQPHPLFVEFIKAAVR